MSTSVFPVRDRPPGRLAVCGGGNAGHTLAVIASGTVAEEILWLTTSEEKAQRLRAGVFSAEGLRSTGVLSGRADKVRTISADPAEVIPPADAVLIAVPAFAHGPILTRIGPFLKDSAWIGVLPARSGFEFDVAHRVSALSPRGGPRVFGLQTLPWSARVQEPSRVVHILARKAQVLMATLPHHEAAHIAPWVSELVGTQIVLTPNFLNLTLGNPGQIIHPGIMYGLFGTWRGTPYAADDIPRFFADVSDETGAIVEELSHEIVMVARRIEAASAGGLDLSGVLPIHEWLRSSYPTQITDATSVATSFRTLAPLQVRKPPMREVSPGEFVPDFGYRYISEDVPFGLAVVKAIAVLADVPTPRLDAVVHWAQEKLEKRYFVGGELGADAQDLRIPQKLGITNVKDLVDWYLRWA